MTSPKGANLLRRVMDARLLDVHTALPCEVLAFDAAAQTVDVQPMVKNVIFGETSELEESYPQILNVPVKYNRSRKYLGGVFPLEAGDFVMVVFNEWSLDHFREKGSEVHPVDPQRHAFSGAVAFPGGPYPADDTIAETIDALLIGYAGGTFLKIPSGGVAEIGTIAGGKEFIAQAAKTKTELDALKTTLDNFITAHKAPGFHVTTATISASAVVGIITSPGGTLHGTVGSVAATKGKVE